MKSVDFEYANTVIGKGQPQYEPIHAWRNDDGEMVMCFQLTPEEMAVILRTGKIWVTQLTFNQSFQPLGLNVVCPLRPTGTPPNDLNPPPVEGN